MSTGHTHTDEFRLVHITTQYQKLLRALVHKCDYLFATFTLYRVLGVRVCFIKARYSIVLYLLNCIILYCIALLQNQSIYRWRWSSWNIAKGSCVYIRWEMLESAHLSFQSATLRYINVLLHYIPLQGYSYYTVFCHYLTASVCLYVCLCTYLPACVSVVCFVQVPYRSLREEIEP